MKNILSNSSSLRAAEYTDKQINTFWVDTQEKSFKEILGLKSLNSKYLLGAKGSGKTHLLRYHSFKVALKRFKNIEKTLQSTRAVCIYLRFPNDTNKFDDLGREKGSIFFTYYMELLILRSFFDLVKDICEINELSIDSYFIASDLISKEEKNFSVKEYLDLIKNKLDEIDEALNYYILWEDESCIKNISINIGSIFKIKNILESIDPIFRTNLDQKTKKEKEKRLKSFIKDFINKALSVINDKIIVDVENLFGSSQDLEKYIDNNFLIKNNNEKIYKAIRDSFIKACDFDTHVASDIFNILAKDIDSLIYLKINIIKFSKLKRVNFENIYQHAIDINIQCKNYLNSPADSSYRLAINHYKNDVVYQLYRHLNNQRIPIYYGFDTLCKITSYNPRNVLNVLYKIEEQLLFENKDFFTNEVIDIETQSRGFREASKYFFNEDTSYGSLSLDAKRSVSKIGDYLHKARFSLKIPEVSPLAISFSRDSFNDDTWKIFHTCIEFSLLQEVGERNDRNNSHKNYKVRLNPMLSPLWSLPIVYRGDLSINNKIVNLIFSPLNSKEFYSELNKIEARWNTISFPRLEDGPIYYQGTLF